MFAGSITTPNTYEHLLANPVWQTIFEWIQVSGDLTDGEYEISERDIYASVQTVTTIPRNEGVFEAHRTYIDLHYCLEGSEVIEWAPVEALSPTQEFDTEKDYGLYIAPPQTSSTVLTPGDFAIFPPKDAHMPKIEHPPDNHVKKIVIKIRETIVSEI